MSYFSILPILKAIVLKLGWIQFPLEKHSVTGLVSCREEEGHILMGADEVVAITWGHSWGSCHTPSSAPFPWASLREPFSIPMLCSFVCFPHQKMLLMHCSALMQYHYDDCRIRDPYFPAKQLIHGNNCLRCRLFYCILVSQVSWLNEYTFAFTWEPAELGPCLWAPFH